MTAVDTMDLELTFLLSPSELPAVLVAPEVRTYRLIRKCPWVGLLDVGVGRAAYEAGLHLPFDPEQSAILEHAAAAIHSLLKEDRCATT